MTRPALLHIGRPRRRLGRGVLHTRAAGLMEDGKETPEWRG